MEIKRERDSLARYKHRPTRGNYVLVQTLKRCRQRKNIKKHLNRVQIWS